MIDVASFFSQFGFLLSFRTGYFPKAKAGFARANWAGHNHRQHVNNSFVKKKSRSLLNKFEASKRMPRTTIRRIRMSQELQEIKKHLSALARLIEAIEAASPSEEPDRYDQIGPALNPYYQSDESVFDPTYAPNILEVRNGKVFWKKSGAKVYTKERGDILKIFRYEYPKEAVIYAINNRKWPPRDLL